jgi:signal-transduction protein with cAMP-binding, CBS, and nucleotidyltransferase domain
MKTGFLVQDVMTKNTVSVTPKDSVLHAAVTMQKEGVGSLVVKDKEDVVGIITKEDIVFKVVAMDKDSSDTKVRTVMTQPILSIAPDKDVYDAIVLMNANKVKHLPVLKEGQLLGQLTLTDILRVEPELLDMAQDLMTLREEHEKPIGKRLVLGECESCMKESEELLDVNHVLLCPTCRGILRPVM